MISLLAAVFLILTSLLAYGTAQPWCFDNGNYTNSSVYGVNVNTLLSSVSAKVDNNGFYNASMGQNLDTVYASVLCRGDVQLSTCRTCIQNASIDVARSCPNRKQAVQFNEFCTLRYSDEPFFRIMETRVAAWYWWNPENASSPDQYTEDVRTLVDSLRDQAAHGGSFRKVAAGNRSTVDFQTVFSLVQCTMDLSSEDCICCLLGATVDIPKFCKIKNGCRVLKPSCTLRYEASPFCNETRLQEIQALTIPPVPPPPPSPSSSTPPGPPPPGNR